MNTWTKSLLIGFGAGIVVYFISSQLRGKIKSPQRFAVFCKLSLASPTFPRNASSALLVLEKRMQAAGFEYNLDLLNEKEPDKELQIEIRLKNIDDTLLCSEIIGSDGRLAITEMYLQSELQTFIQALSDTILQKRMIQYSAPSTDPIDTLNELLTAEKIAKKEKENDLDEILETSYVQPAVIGSVKIGDTTELGALMRAVAPGNLPADLVFSYGTASTHSHISAGVEGKIQLYALKMNSSEKPMLDNSDILEARQDFEDNRVIVALQFTERGSRVWEFMTSRNVNRPLAMLVGGKVISAPTVTEAIKGGNTIINADFSISEARAIALLLSGEPLPAKPEILQFKVSVPGTGETGRKLLLSGIAFLFITIASLLIFKTLKST